MKLFLVVCLALAATVSAEEIRSPAADNPIFGYHSRFGIPEAARIKKLEQAGQTSVTGGQRIVGGNLLAIANAPYQVGLVVQILVIFESVCAGALVSPTQIVTAAHCYYDGVISASSLTAVLGSNTIFTGGTRITTTNVITHPEFSPSEYLNNIAIVGIPAVTLSNVIQPIRLPSDDELTNDFVGVTALASGYGLTYDGGFFIDLQPLSGVSVPVISNLECLSVYGPLVVSDTNICTSGAGGKNPCTGDAGAPLVATSNDLPTLIGIFLHGSANGCSIGLPAVFTRISSYVDWINSVQ